MQDTSDERKSLGMRRCKSAMLARELPPSETAVRKTTIEILVFDEDANQIVIEEVLDKAPSRLRRCKSAAKPTPAADGSEEVHASTLRRCKSAAEFPVADASDEVHDSNLRRCKSSIGGLTVENNLDDDHPYKLCRCESADLFP